MRWGPLLQAGSQSLKGNWSSGKTGQTSAWWRPVSTSDPGPGPHRPPKPQRAQALQTQAFEVNQNMRTRNHPSSAIALPKNGRHSQHGRGGQLTQQHLLEQGSSHLPNRGKSQSLGHAASAVLTQMQKWTPRRGRLSSFLFGTDMHYPLQEAPSRKAGFLETSWDTPLPRTACCAVPGTTAATCPSGLKVQAGFWAVKALILQGLGNASFYHPLHPAGAGRDGPPHPPTNTADTPGGAAWEGVVHHREAHSTTLPT